MSAILETSGVVIGYPGHVLARGIDLHLHKGEVTALVGLNGSGKSTLLRALAGLSHPLEGSVKVLGRELGSMSSAERARSLSMVLSGRPQLGLVDVRTLVSLGRQPWTNSWGSLTDADNMRVDEAMRSTGTSAFENHFFDSLSDGEAQKVLIARAVAQDAPLMLLDEPTAHLDVVNRITVLRLLKQVASAGRSILLSTHDIGTAMELCDRFVLLHEGSAWAGTREEAVTSGVLDRAFAVRDPL